MGRGRAKAKQTKVARELKYRTYETDLGALQQELAGSKSESDGNGHERQSADLDSPGVDEPDNDDDDWAAGRRN